MIFILEDDDNLREVLLELVSSLTNERVVAAKCNDEAATILHKTKPRIMLVDYYLQGTTCKKLLEISKDLFQDDPPKIVIMTAAAPTRLEQIKTIGHPFLRKPFSIEEIEKILE